ncbi:uncharacterized protein DNG_02285 [Cephalotrichum gorgonifer]|uniref:DUF7735 domain-containing protein n=1 Tax=Cephalotrichum gorgonifer TaxID=2041049 RepID=A0AAE8MSR1_9PEZI|nr:uncharacterized protein DNG_02285 [Cephalotrichum gorgonifer]
MWTGPFDSRHKRRFALNGAPASNASAPSTFASSVAGVPPATRTSLERRQADTTTAEPPARTISEDPWQCITENITQYFVDLPTPTGNVQWELGSFGDKANEPCMATATGKDIFSCTISEPEQWCGFTTAMPADVLPSYSAYISSAVSFWTAKSATMSELATSCPVAWSRPDLAQHEWMKIVGALAECHLRGSGSGSNTDLDEPTTTTAPTDEPTPTETENKAISGKGMALGSLALLNMGLAVMANAA